MTRKNPNPLMSAPLYTEQVHDLQKEKKAQICFVDKELKPLAVSKQKIERVATSTTYKNHLAFLPRKGDKILVSGEDMYTVYDVIHVLPTMRSDTQKIYIVIE